MRFLLEKSFYAITLTFENAIYLSKVLFPNSIHRRHGMERREVLPVVDTVADTREDLPRGHVRRSARPR